MDAFFSKLFPNVVSNLEVFNQAIIQTLQMVAISGVISFLLSLTFGILIVITKNGGILANRIVWNILDKIINLFRSIPFIILIAALIPVTRIISGTAIGVKGTIFPLIVGITPFFTRQIESALNETDDGLIETGEVIGLTPWQLVWSVYLHESISSISRVTTITIVSLIGLTAIVGVVGGGGLGDFAIQYGYQQNQFDATIACIIVLLILVSIVQIIGTFISKKATH
ncbi:methionine ABC transporter [Liquorilactobacillus sucicola DSM 21376 = JCM 15457]|uniref:ABC superfamily ATP binding cassette transporter, membrane protein n=1 Tax=Liquorilactobacillus sucicola DSM 21376 = JCM 15457 TaxID=1423806 RepID=A0A023CZD8_9LACO|nr:methionine ABC transporter permease [Liquorilactobacillus sucicola]KRN07497.1 ABC superfamily ATP binding cassette transporter, membrane protein [Liquorilactobacillus sucicola DSM 21376 = JCM 15457]GAJ26875.1 methionine ABC transporter [Liquorilactobacillus sucicola DSM 21376 = JCM 15457]